MVSHSDNPVYQKRLAFVEKEMPLLSSKVLDIGCGNGGVSSKLVELGHDVTGIDVDAEAIDKARKLIPQGRFYIKDIEDMKNIAGWDVVVMLEVLEHTRNPALVLGNIRYLLNSGGILILSVPNGYAFSEILINRLKLVYVFKHIYGFVTGIQPSRNFPFYDDSPHLQYFTLSYLVSFLGEYGFEISKVRNTETGMLIPGVGRFGWLKKCDCLIADYLPHAFAGGWIMVAKKISYPSRWIEAQTLEEKGYRTMLDRWETPIEWERVYQRTYGIRFDYFNGKRVLDVGCGSYGLIHYLNVPCYKVGLDPLIDKYQDLISRSEANKLITGRAEEMPFDDSSFDVVCCFNVLDHLYSPSKAFSEMNRVLCSGGTILFTVNVFNYLPRVVRRLFYYFDREHLFHFSSKEVESLLKQYSLNIDMYSCKSLLFHNKGWNRHSLKMVVAKMLGIQELSLVLRK